MEEMPLPQQPIVPPQMGGQSPMMPHQESPEEEAQDVTLAKAIESHNLAEGLKDEKRRDIGEFVYNGYKTDLDSRKGWDENVEKWTKLALQTVEKKNFPWTNASNMKYPLLSTAAMQFAARAYPALVPSDGKLVNTRVVGQDPQGMKADKAERISDYMSWQLLYDMDNWEEEMDRMLIILPVAGLCYKKTYWDGSKKKIVSRLIMPKDLVVNYWAKSLEETERKTERIEMTKRVLKERQLAGVYRKVDLPAPILTTPDKQNASGAVQPTQPDDTTPYTILEQHTFYDLDGDGYPEPYIITIEEQSKEVLRIVARFTEDDIVRDEQQKLVKINPIEYYTKFPFIPNPDGSFYDVGFGLLLGSINETVNTSINQLIDAGTLNNLPSGFIGKNLRLREGEIRFQVGEWKQVNATGEQMKNSILPLPVKEPSNVLLSLMQALIQSGKELASVAEIFTGKMPGQNTPATTTMTSVEQGMKVFTAIYKRIFKSLEKEYKKIFELNGVYLDPEQAQQVLDQPMALSDFDEDNYDVCPGADPTAFSSTQKLLKAQALMELLPTGLVNAQEVVKRILEAQEQPHIEKLVNQGPPPPDPKTVEMQQKMELEKAKTQSKIQTDQFKAELEARTAQTRQAMEQEKQAQELEFKRQQAALELRIKELESKMKLAGTAMDVKAKQVQHVQNLAHKQDQHQQKLEQARQNDVLKNKNKP